jgi:hypothetical protein
VNFLRGQLVLDPYDRRARLAPALLTLAPVIVFFDCYYSPSNPVLSAVVSLFALCGGMYALTRVARDAGYRLQDKLFQKWGGAPTTQLLRHRTPHVDPHTKARCHSLLAKALKKPFPSATEEATNPSDADDLYRAGTKWLISQTKDIKKYPAVSRENVAYGFQRNMLGLRPLALIFAVATLACSFAACEAYRSAWPFMALSSVAKARLAIKIPMAFYAAMLLTWLFMFSEGAARRTAFAYAERLILGCDEVGRGLCGGCSIS